MRKHKRIGLLVTVLPVFVMAAVTTAFVISRTHVATARLREAINTEASDRLQAKVSIGRFEVSPIGIVRLHDVTIASADGKGPPILAVSQVKITCRLMDIAVRRVSPVQSIERVEVISPKLYLERGRDGRWNIADLLKPTAKPPSAPFTGVVQVRAGRVLIRDLAHDPARSETNVLRAVNAVVDVTSHPIADYQASAVGQKGRLGRIAVTGRYNLDSGSFNADLGALNADVRYWSAYPKKMKFMNVLAGTMRAGLTVSRQTEKDPTRYSGVLSFRDSAVRFAKIRSPVEQVNGRIFVRNGVARLDLRGQLGSTPVSAYGDVIGFDHPNILLELNSNSANLRELASLSRYSSDLKRLRLPNRGRCRVVAHGPSRRPRLDFDLRAPSIAYKWFRARDVRAVGEYYSGRVKVRTATAQTFGGQMRAVGEIGGGASLDFHGRVSNLDLSRVTSLSRQGFSGKTSGRFRAQLGSGGSRLDYTGTADAGSMRGFRFTDAEVSTGYRDKVIEINEISGRLMDGLVAASGRISMDGKLDLEVSGADINLAAVQKKYWREHTEGRIYFAGKVTGTAESPVYTGDVEAQPLTVSDIGVERIEAKLTASRDTLDLHDLVIHQYPGAVTVSGTVRSPLEPGRQLDLTVGAREIDIKPLMRYSESAVDVEGKLSADLTVTGSGTRPLASGTAWVTEGRIGSQPVSNAYAVLDYKNGVLTVSDMGLQSGEASLWGSGEVGRGGALHIEFTGVRVPVSEVARPLVRYASVSGEADILGGVVSGTVKSPEVSLGLDVTPLRINGETFASLSGRVSWQDGRLSTTGLTLDDGEWVFSAPKLEYSHADRLVEIETTLTRGDMSRIVRMIERSPAFRDAQRLRELLASVPKPIQGAVDGSAWGTIRLTDGRYVPDLHVDLTLGNLRSGTGDFETVALRGAWSGDTTRLDHLEAISGDTNITGSGSIGPNRALVLNLDAHNIELASLGRWAKLRHNISGVADVTIVAGGTTSAPDGQASLDVTNPSIGTSKFDGLRARLSTGEASSAGQGIQSVNVDELTLVLASKELTASGFIPVEWRTLKIPEDGALSLDMVFDSAVLDLLPGFTNAIAKGSTGGTVAGNLKVDIPAAKGGLKSPNLKGDLAWTDGRIRFTGIDSELRNIRLRCVFDGDTARVEECTGTSSDGGSFTVSGNIGFADLKTKLDLALRTNALGLSWTDLTRKYREVVDCSFDSQLTIKEDHKSPLISGTVAVRKGLLDLTAKPAKTAVAIEHSVDPRFGGPEGPIRITLGREVELKTGSVRTPMYGEMTVSGSLSKPSVDGRADLTGGTIHFPTRVFRIQSGSDMTVQYRPPLADETGKEQPRPPAVLVDIKAQGRLVALSGLGRRKRYTVTMEAQGPLDKLQPRFTSSPPDLSEQRILALLTGQHQIEQVLMGETGRDVSRGLSGIFSTAMGPTVLAPLGEALGAAFGFEEFELEGGYEEPLQLSIADRLWDGLYLSYTSSLGARPDYADSLYELRLQYRFPRGLELGITTDEQKEVGVRLEGKLRF